MKRQFTARLMFSLPLIALGLCGCSGGGPGDDAGGASSGDGSVVPEAQVTTAASGGSSSSFDLGDLMQGTGGSAQEETKECASTSAEAELEPVQLLFLLDDSASMGGTNIDKQNSRWNPVTGALNAFFSDPASAGLLASLTFFPLNNNLTQGDHDGSEPSCNNADYSTPVVPPTHLPHPGLFASAIGLATPANEFGTPTYPALAGTIDYAQSLEAEGTETAIILVTDGEPYSCDPENVNNIENIAALAGSVAEEIPTYVIGVGNVSGLHEIAAAGGTESAFVVALDDPDRTRTELLTQVQAIRAAQVSCDVVLPEAPPGESLDVSKVNVELTVDAEHGALLFDEACTSDIGWRYDNPEAPSSIELCPQICDLIQGAEQVKLEVILGCETEEHVVR
jgi:hypothetical protein